MGHRFFAATMSSKYKGHMYIHAKNSITSPKQKFYKEHLLCVHTEYYQTSGLLVMHPIFTALVAFDSISIVVSIMVGVTTSHHATNQ